MRNQCVAWRRASPASSRSLLAAAHLIRRLPRAILLDELRAAHRERGPLPT